MKPFFEIKYSNGLARKGRLLFSTQKRSTPFLLTPHSVDNSNNSVLGDEILIPSEESLQFNYIAESGYEKEKPIPRFVHCRSIFGINYGELPDQKGLFQKLSNELSGSNCELCQIDKNNSCIILHDVPPAKTSDRLNQYENSLNEKRLELYSSDKYKSQIEEYSFVLLGITFSTDKDKLMQCINFLNSNPGYSGVYVRDLYRNTFNFNEILEFILTIKKSLPANLLFIVGGQFPLGAIPILLYLGVDGFDLSYQFAMASQGFYVTDFDNEWLDRLHQLPCNCNFCQEIVSNKKPSNPIELSLRNIDLVNSHILWKSKEYILKFNYFQDKGLLREFVESETAKIPELVSLLRQFDNYYINNKYPQFRRIMSNRIQCPTSLSHSRPEIIDFIETIKENVYPDEQYELYVLLPCSASKPYSRSPSHQRFLRAIRRAIPGSLYKTIVHEIIITSPLGIVPRDLETVFPAAHYNVSVTGNWSDEEIQLSADCLYHYLKKAPKKVPIIAHVSGGYLKAVKRTEQMLQKDKENGMDYPLIKDSTINFEYTVLEQEYATSEEALTSLTNTMLKAYEKITSSQNKNHPREDKMTVSEMQLAEVCKYQFGKGSESAFIGMGVYFAPSRSGEYTDIQQYDGLGKMIVGRIYQNHGFIKPNFEGGRILHEIGRDILYIKDTTLKGTTIFPPILEKISNPDLRVGDFVAVVNSENEYIGVAELNVSASEASRMTYGAVATIMKK